MHDWFTLNIAYHEAAHAVAAVVQGCPIINCNFDADLGNGCVNIPVFHPEQAGPVELRKHAVMLLAGWEAQLHHMPSLNAELFEQSIAGDMETARNLVKFAVQGVEERQATFSERRSAARKLVEDNWGAIQRVGQALADKGRLTADDVVEIVENR